MTAVDVDLTAVTMGAGTYGGAGGLTVPQVVECYGIRGPSGILFGGTQGDGSHQTIAIVVAYHDIYLSGDVQAFDGEIPGIVGFNLPGLQLSESGAGVSDSDSETDRWAMEATTDVEWAHAIAPAARIDLVETSRDDVESLVAAAQYAASLPGVSVVSMSWGNDGTEPTASQEAAMDAALTTPPGHSPVVFVAASGDSGYYGGSDAKYPAVSPNVIAVGGTTLTYNQLGTGDSAVYSRNTEAYWSPGGNGASANEPLPTFQRGFGLDYNGRRFGPDVSMYADLVPVYDTFSNRTTPNMYWESTDGTSLAAPMFAALVAIIDQGRAGAGLPLFDTATLHTALFNAAYDLPPTQATIFYNAYGKWAGGIGFGSPLDSSFATTLATAPLNLVAQGDFGVGDQNGDLLSAWQVQPEVTDDVDPGALAAVWGGYQVVTNLMPDTTYLLTGYGKVDAPGTSGALRVLYYGGPPASVPITSTTFAQQAVVFTTGPAATGSAFASALIMLSTDQGGDTYFENINLQKLCQAGNWGFEAGSLAGWTTTTGNGGAPSADSADPNPSSASSFDAMLPTGSTISETITGLQPNSTYTISVFAGATLNAGNATLSYPWTDSNAGGELDSTTWSVPANSYGQKSISFSTGTSLTDASYIASVTVTLESNTGVVYFDDVSLSQVFTPSTGAVFNVPAGENYTYQGYLPNEWPGLETVTKLGAGTLTLTGSNTYTGGTTVAAGQLVFVSGARPYGDTLTLDAGATAVTFDEDLETIVREITATPPTILGDPDSAGTPTAYSVGYLTTAQYNTLHSLSGAAALPPGGVILRYTWRGDVNLDGVVSLPDYQLTDLGYVSGFNDNAWWHDGDFNYDGFVDYNDYAWIDASYHAQNGNAALSTITAHAVSFGIPYLQDLVEDAPMTIALSTGTTITNTGTLYLPGYDVGLLTNIHNQGTIVFTSSVDLSGVTLVSGTYEIAGGVTATMAYGNCTVDWAATLSLLSGSTLTVGTQTGAPPDREMEIDGSLLVNSASLTIALRGFVYNCGDVELNNGTLVCNGLMMQDYPGTLNVNAGSTLEISSLFYNLTATVNVAGLLQIDTGGCLDNFDDYGATLNISGPVNNSGVIYWQSNGDAPWSWINNQGTISFDSVVVLSYLPGNDGSYEITGGGDAILSTNWTLYGTLEVDSNSALIINSGVTLTNYGTIWLLHGSNTAGIVNAGSGQILFY